MTAVPPPAPEEEGMRLVLLGDPVAHSLSPVMHQAALDALGIAGSYEARRVDGAGMRAAAAELREGSIHGANITMPHKRLAFDLCDRTEIEAGRAGSVNTWVLRRGEIVGHSTDVTGLRRVWTTAGLPHGAPVLVLGTGGAAAAALIALESHPRLLLAGRRAAAAAALVRRVAPRAEVVPWGSVAAGAVVVNATPLGMQGEALPHGVLEAAAGLVDLAYGPDETSAVHEAKGRGLPVADGIAMLAAQAAASFRLWVGEDPPESVMERAARNASSGFGPTPKQRAQPEEV